ncbi:type II toxin-antitoxin system VapC family toxin [Rhodopseudomonas palustris]|uniref:type II toxin-antitoxin system VapC family toxin n=1 Tax=Rhodopseudomonas palustris TaxID=1076 RepID=UPI002ACD7C93|nr:type II toxin-antitoxin system VapC family toxin [Rhodopseudomonas palustris]WQG99725.1 type II toxin-antitoxin system VapC family toxin [Rhodopseudomonas palustris]
MICLDTNVVIGIINGRAPQLETRFRETIGVVPVALPVIALFELRYGYAKSNRRVQMEALLGEFLAPGVTILPFGEEDAAEAGDIRADLEVQGVPIGFYDVLIAAQARARGAILVTANRREFERVPGLMVTDWAA